MPGNVNTLLSIVVPTRNRAECASSLLRALHSSPAEGFEVVIQDNSSTPELAQLVEKLADPRLRYFYCSDTLNMHQNFDAAIKSAVGEYICAIGDDDGLNLNAALKMLQKAKQADIDAVVPELYFFGWPGLRHSIWGDVGGLANRFRLHPELSEQVIESDIALRRLFNKGAYGGLDLLPRVYQGFVSRRSLDALLAECGTYFPGASPDMANAVAVSAFVNRILFTPEPIIITGHSAKSGGGQGAAGTHHGRLEDQAHLPAGTLTEWDSAIPRFWSGTTIYAQSAVSAAMASGSKAGASLNYAKIYAACLMFEPKQYRPDIFRAAKTLQGNRLLLWLRVGTAYGSLAMKRAMSLLRNIAFYRFGFGSLGRFPDIESLMMALSRNAR